MAGYSFQAAAATTAAATSNATRPMLMGTSGSAGWPVGHERQDRVVTLRADAGGAPGVGGVVVVVSGLLLVVAGGVALRHPLRVRRGVDLHVRSADPDLGHVRSSPSSGPGSTA